METLLFTPVQLISLLGMAQTLYAIVYMVFRAGRLSRASLPIFYFFILFCGFFTDLSAPFFKDIWTNAFYISWIFWFLLPSLSYLLVLQIAKIHEMPSWKNYLILLLPFLAFMMGHFMFKNIGGFYVTGVLSGSISLLLVWFRKSLLSDIWADGKAGHPRYWLIICLMIVNIVFLGSALFLLLNIISSDNWVLIRNILGLGFVYITSTSLFRIYPQAVLVKGHRRLDLENLKNRKIIENISSLLESERVYQEAQYSRKNFAQELDIAEATVSKIINDTYEKTVPQLLNYYRVEEAKGLLLDTNVPIQVIANEVGFYSLTTFNRVFKESVGITPSQFKEQRSYNN